MDVSSIPKAIWDFKDEATRNKAIAMYTQIIQTNQNQGLAIGTTLAALQKEGMDMTKGYVPEPITNNQKPAAQMTKPVQQAPTSLPKQSFVQPYLFNPEDFR